MKRLIISLATFFLICLEISAQENVQKDSTAIISIETNDGNTFTGIITEETDAYIILLTERLGKIQISKRDIKSQIHLQGIRKEKGEYWLPNPQSTRYFWAPNGYGLNKGESYYQNIWVFYNQFSWGITQSFSMSAGMIPLFLFGAPATPIWVVPKFSLPVVENKFNLGAGAFLGTIVGADTGVFGLLFGTATMGTRDKNLSIGLAQGFAADGWLEVPIINISGMSRTGSKGYFITENYLITADGEVGLLFSAGGRSIIRNIGLDYSLWIPVFPGMGSFVAAPFLGITVPLGKKSR
jgi:hypothetical protein